MMNPQQLHRRASLGFNYDEPMDGTLSTNYDVSSPSSPVNRRKRSHSLHFTYLERRNSYSNSRRKLLLEGHLNALRENLIEDLSRIYAQDLSVLSCSLDEVQNVEIELSNEELHQDFCTLRQDGEGYPNIDTNDKPPEKLVGVMVREFVSSLPPRYVLSIDSPGEALVHMRHVASVKRMPLNAYIHIKPLDCNDNLTFSTHGSNNLKVVVVCCSHTIGLMEFLMGTLVSGGNEIFDTNYLLTSDKIMLVSVESRSTIDCIKLS